ncbi:hypothetical protein ACFQZZ_13530 [Nocardia sp. GCM10030253]|uniref:hypothetical protein n=1 Tax=Nocardia sp. GCM10030253 TaxID=3273404 RepID=UPI003639E8A0
MSNTDVETKNIGILTTQSHWVRIAEGKAIEHWANRDDLGTATQLGWAPPSPAYLARMQMATRRARRNARRATH